jgi:hypothetical protein
MWRGKPVAKFLQLKRHIIILAGHGKIRRMLNRKPLILLNKLFEFAPVITVFVLVYFRFYIHSFPPPVEDIIT